MDLINTLVVSPMPAPIATAKIIQNVAIKSLFAVEIHSNPSRLDPEVIAAAASAVYLLAHAAESAPRQRVS